MIDSDEECDNGIDNAQASDECRITCEDPYCGDGIIDYNLGETCDDGNRTLGDGCDLNCQDEGWG